MGTRLPRPCWQQATYGTLLATDVPVLCASKPVPLHCHNTAFHTGDARRRPCPPPPRMTPHAQRTNVLYHIVTVPHPKPSPTSTTIGPLPSAVGQATHHQRPIEGVGHDMACCRLLGPNPLATAIECCQPEPGEGALCLQTVWEGLCPGRLFGSSSCTLVRPLGGCETADKQPTGEGVCRDKLPQDQRQKSASEIARFYADLQLQRTIWKCASPATNPFLQAVGTD